MKSRKKSNRKSSPDRPGSILLAEDDLEMRKLLAWSLTHKGYQVTQCADGTSLMGKLGLLGPGHRAQPHDLIISDIRMPGRTGLEVLESARELPDFPPMILITAFPDAESQAQAERLGALAMMAKPFDIEELLDKVRETVSTESQRRRPAEGLEESGRPPFPFEITFRHESGSEAAMDYIRGVAARLHPFADHVLSGRIIVDQSNNSEHKKHRHEITLVLSTPGKSIIIKHNTDRGATSENLYMAINLVFGTASQKLKHRVQKQYDHRKHNLKKSQFLEEAEPDESEQPDTDMNRPTPARNGDKSL
jgi:DNA-binding response OmpR family regulator